MCRIFLVGFVALLVAAPSRAQDAKLNTLSPKEIADGWIVLFDGETSFGWKVRGPARIQKGEWLIGGDEPAVVETAAQFADGVVAFQHRQLSEKSNAEFTLRGRELGLAGDAADPAWREEFIGFEKGELTQKIPLGKLAAGAGMTIYLGVPEKKLGSFRIVVPAKSQLAVRNVRFRPDADQALFNGKDLAGWKIFPGKKSEFAVEGGAINIKNGPGDLQTEKKFGDFCLQLECISHGEHLNSGVFFRCRDGEDQNGYEAQIRNQFTAQPTQKYSLEEYDPETHKLLGKKEAMFTAVDFGTGAIYRRQPARKAVAKDKEWFTMTVVAHSNHLATWVNGIQVTDWYDNRARSDNARTGCRLEAGHISLQGHDPTTNLSFRNFRIQAYPPVK